MSMTRFKDLSLGAKQGVGFGLILLLMTGMSVFAISQMDVLRGAIKEVNNTWLQRVIAVSSINYDAATLRTHQLQVVSSTEEEDREAYILAILGLIDAIDQGLDVYRQAAVDTTDAGEARARRVFADLDLQWENYKDLFLLIAEFYEEQRNEEALGLINGEAGRVFEAFSADLDTLVALSREGAAEAGHRAERTYASSRNITLFLLLLSIVGSGFIAGFLVRRIAEPVRLLERAAERVAAGDLRARTGFHSRDEIGRLARSFNRMTNALRESRERSETQQAALQARKEEIEQANVELEAALAQLRETQEQLILREKMASLGQLTAGIAHEIKNPLNFINNFAALSVETSEELEGELELWGERPVSEAKAALSDLLHDLTLSSRKIREHGLRADAIVRSMLEHSRGSSAERRCVDLHGLLDEYLNLSYHGMRATVPTFNVTMERDYDRDVGELELVTQEMGRVLINLFNNAFYAVHQRSRHESADYQPRVLVRTRRQRRQVEIRIEDNGEGIPPEIRERIFEPFFTTKPTGEGTGLGLSLSYDIVVQGHQGTMEVESKPGEGAAFILRLPLPSPGRGAE